MTKQENRLANRKIKVEKITELKKSIKSIIQQHELKPKAAIKMVVHMFKNKLASIPGGGKYAEKYASLHNYLKEFSTANSINSKQLRRMLRIIVKHKD